jgi:hypothetical protein
MATGTAVFLYDSPQEQEKVRRSDHLSPVASSHSVK